MKGYENLKVSIPTSGLDLQHTLDRSPSTTNGCKLAALADIALGNDVPLDLIEPQPVVSDGKHSSKLSKLNSNINLSAKTSMKHLPSLLMSSDSTRSHSIEIKSKSFETAFSISPKNKKRSHQSIGKKTGYKERKKKSRSMKSQKDSTKKSTSSLDTSKPKDIYDFEESHDSVEDEIIPLTHTRTSKTDSQTNIDVKTEENVKKSQHDEQEDESSYSDRDDYYNFNSVSGSGTEDQENPIDEDENSDREIVQTSKSTKSTNNSQKKCLIMGRIFKNAKKNSETTPTESKEKLPTTKPIPKKELDEIFDNLKNKNAESEKRASTECRTKSPKNLEKKTERKSDLNDDETGVNERVKVSRTSKKSHRSREIANLESMESAIEHSKRKTQRRCATNRQNKVVETWSSDEYEDFHATKDIIALIQEAEMKEQRSRDRSSKQTTEVKNDMPNDNETKSSDSECGDSKSNNKENNRKGKTSSEHVIDNESKEVNSNEKIDESTKSKSKKISFNKFQSEGESDFDEHWNKSAKRAKIRNRRRTVISREEALEERRIKEKSIKKQQQNTTKKQSHAVDKRQKPSKEVENVVSNSGKSSSKPSGKSSKGNKVMPRRKRIASEMLYYWSSSSDEEFGRIEPSENDDDNDNNSENHLEQHGWIVGDSHKKLVTLLAHAKGKKIEDCGVKESVHKRK